jgi:hypothetical protein
MDSHGGMILTGETGAERPIPVPHCLPQIPHGLTQDRIWLKRKLPTLVGNRNSVLQSIISGPNLTGLALKMETSVSTYASKRRHDPKHQHRHLPHRENLSSDLLVGILYCHQNWRVAETDSVTLCDETRYSPCSSWCRTSYRGCLVSAITSTVPFLGEHFSFFRHRNNTV